jgi:hypothetical protein
MNKNYIKAKTSEKSLEKINETERFMALSGIEEGDKKFLTNESFQQTIREEKGDDDESFIVLEFEQINVPSGEDDDLYEIKMKKDD